MFLIQGSLDLVRRGGRALMSAFRGGGGAPDDAELVALARRGGARGRRAYAQLVDRHQPWLLRFLTALLGSSADAEDVAQEALTKAYLALPGLRDGASFRAWLRRVAAHQAYNSRRKRRERPAAEGAIAALIDVAPGADRLADWSALVDVLQALPYPYREVLVLRHVDELSMDEIATTLGVGLSAAKMRLKRARERFIETYEERVGDGL